MLLMEEERPKSGVPDFARIVSVATTGIEPEIMGLGPVNATQKALKKAELSMSDMELIEVNKRLPRSIWVVKNY